MFCFKYYCHVRNNTSRVTDNNQGVKQFTFSPSSNAYIENEDLRGNIGPTELH